MSRKVLIKISFRAKVAQSLAAEGRVILASHLLRQRMKKALLLTDGSVDMALSLNRWLETQPAPVNLTIVYAFSLPQAPDQSLKAAAYRQARQEASERLTHWLDFLPQSWPDQIHTEILLGDPNLVLTIHLLLRRYDYLLIDSGQTEVLSTFMTCQSQVSTQLRCLSVSETFSAPELIPEIGHPLSFVPTNGLLAA